VKPSRRISFCKVQFPGITFIPSVQRFLNYSSATQLPRATYWSSPRHGSRVCLGSSFKQVAHLSSVVCVKSSYQRPTP
jgi:hypothetical protein